MRRIFVLCMIGVLAACTAVSGVRSPEAAVTAAPAGPASTPGLAVPAASHSAAPSVVVSSPDSGRAGATGGSSTGTIASPTGGASGGARAPTAIPIESTATSRSLLATAQPLSGTLPAFSHVFVVVMENHEASQIAGNQEMPYLNRLAAQYGRAANYYAVSHPSLPNYLALIAGDTFGVTSDCLDCFVNADNLAAQLDQAKRSWKAYMEDMPGPCFTGAAAGRYVQRHDPFIYFDDVRNDPTRCHKIMPLTQFDADLAGNSVPDFAWITPNVCDDMHDCPVAAGDAWLQMWVPKIVASPAWQRGGVLFVLFDEGTTSEGCCRYAGGGHVDALVISPMVRPGFVSQAPYDHYSVLRTVEESWDLPLLGRAGDSSTLAMADFFSK